MEDWKPIPDTVYAISSLGRVRRETSGKGTYSGRLIKPQLCTNGYLFVNLSNGDGSFAQQLLHRLVAEAFILNPDNLPDVNHKNGVKIDCAADNLEWTTKSNNQQHAVLNGLKNRDVHYYKINGKMQWRARIMVNGVHKHVGYFATEQEAMTARLAAEIKYWGITQ